jgi:hypothetical protein
MLARRLTTILPAMTLAEAIETTRIHRVAGLTGNRTALVTTRPCRAPHHPLSDPGLIGGWPTMVCASWMNARSSGAMTSRSGANRSRRASQIYNLAGVLDLNAFVWLAIRVMAVRDSGSARQLTGSPTTVTTAQSLALLLFSELCSRLMLFA